MWYNNNAIDNFEEVDKRPDRLGVEDRKDQIKVQRFLLDLSSLEGLEAFEVPNNAGNIQYFRQNDLAFALR